MVEVAPRDQGEVEADPMDGVLCMHCGSGEDDNLLLLCDGAQFDQVACAEGVQHLTRGSKRTRARCDDAGAGSW